MSAAAAAAARATKARCPPCRRAFGSWDRKRPTRGPFVYGSVCTQEGIFGGGVQADVAGGVQAGGGRQVGGLEAE